MARVRALSPRREREARMRHDLGLDPARGGADDRRHDVAREAARAAARPLAGRRSLLGLAGYALEGSPSLHGKPVAAHEEPEGFGEAITDQRQGMADRFGPRRNGSACPTASRAWGIPKQRRRPRKRAGEISRQCRSVGRAWQRARCAWRRCDVAGSGARVRRGCEARSVASGAALLRRAGAGAGRRPESAERVWSQLLARSPADAPWRPDLEMRLAQLRQALVHSCGR